MTVIRAGALNRRVTIQTRSTAIDASGGQSVTWSDLAAVWAGIEELAAHEQMAAEAVQAVVTHQITIRYQTQFADPKAVAGMRAVLIKDGVTRIFNITGCHDDGERRREIILDAVEGLNNG